MTNNPSVANWSANQFPAVSRLAATGKFSGSSLCRLLQVLGKERVMARIEKALATLN